MIRYVTSKKLEFFVYDAFITVDYSEEDPNWIRYIVHGVISGDITSNNVSLEIFDSLPDAIRFHKSLMALLELNREISTPLYCFADI